MFCQDRKFGKESLAKLSRNDLSILSKSAAVTREVDMEQISTLKTTDIIEKYLFLINGLGIVIDDELN